MPTTLQTSATAWQGLVLSLNPDVDSLSDPASWVAGELLRLGGSAPAPILLLAMERHGYDRPQELLIDALCDEPHAFTFARK